MTSRFRIAEFDALEAAEAPEHAVSWVDVSEALACEQMRVRVWTLHPGGALKYHRQREQEELYVPLDGPGQLRIDDEVVDVSAGAAVRVPPETPRQPVNETTDTHRWLIVGAPPAADDASYISTDDE
jgi:quercetin dioxygenase-like cupin family protein